MEEVSGARCHPVKKVIKEEDFALVTEAVSVVQLEAAIIQLNLEVCVRNMEVVFNVVWLDAEKTIKKEDIVEHIVRINKRKVIIFHLISLAFGW
jgi:hypothetical protein